MSAHEDLRETANDLRSTAAGLIRRAEQLEGVASELEAQSTSTSAAPEPLSHTDSDDEAAARLIALEAAASGRDRNDLLGQLERDFPSVDAESLVQRFYN